MKILFSIIINALILYAMTYLLGANADKSLEAGIILGCENCSYSSLNAIKTYLIGGVILGVINVTIRPILKILSLPLFFLFLGLVTFFINGIVLYLFTYIINEILIIPGIAYQINGTLNFVIAVAIFTVLNTLYALIPFTK